VKRDPASAVYRNNLASGLAKIMDFNGAKAAVEKVIEHTNYTALVVSRVA
jgi:hypothetical protein